MDDSKKEKIKNRNGGKLLVIINTSFALATCGILAGICLVNILNNKSSLPIRPEKIPIPSRTINLKWYEKSNWYELSDNAKEEDIGIEIQPTKENCLTQSIRLIDIDHDTISNNNKKAHTTFEFVNPIELSLEEKSYNYKQLDEIESFILYKLSSNDKCIGFINNIKTVRKENSNIANDVDCKIFNLSISEIMGESNLNDGKQYKYYMNNKSPIKYKENKPINYWTRTNLGNTKFIVNKKGDIELNNNENEAIYIAPAFSI